MKMVFRHPALFSTVRRGAVVLIAGALLAGCFPKPPTCHKANIYTGPTESLESVVNRINQNNSKLPSLWCSMDFQAWIADGGKTTYVDGYGDIQYRSPADFRLNCKKAGAGEIMVLGTNADTYWLTVQPDQVDTMWWGRTKYIGSPRAQPIPIDPTLVAQVLGVGHIDTNFLNQPAPILQFDNNEDAYVITWTVRLPDQWAAQRQVWFERKTFLPFRVLLYGDKGRVLLRADLSDYRQVKTDQGTEVGAKVAGVYDLSFPDTGSRMILRLRDTLVSRKGFPKDISFQLPLQNPGVGKVVEVDEACGP
jgi:hypothetical protein